MKNWIDYLAYTLLFIVVAGFISLVGYAAYVFGDGYARPTEQHYVDVESIQFIPLSVTVTVADKTSITSINPQHWDLYSHFQGEEFRTTVSDPITAASIHVGSRIQVEFRRGRWSDEITWARFIAK